MLHLLCPSHPSGGGRMEGKVLGEESVSSDKTFDGLGDARKPRNRNEMHVPLGFGEGVLDPHPQHG